MVRNNIFGIRKLKTGVASVAIASALFALNAETATAQEIDVLGLEEIKVSEVSTEESMLYSEPLVVEEVNSSNSQTDTEVLDIEENDETGDSSAPVEESYEESSDFESSEIPGSDSGMVYEEPQPDESAVDEEWKGDEEETVAEPDYESEEPEGPDVSEEEYVSSDESGTEENGYDETSPVYYYSGTHDFYETDTYAELNNELTNIDNDIHNLEHNYTNNINNVENDRYSNEIKLAQKEGELAEVFAKLDEHYSEVSYIAAQQDYLQEQINSSVDELTKERLVAQYNELDNQKEILLTSIEDKHYHLTFLENEYYQKLALQASYDSTLAVMHDDYQSQMSKYYEKRNNLANYFHFLENEFNYYSRDLEEYEYQYLEYLYSDKQASNSQLRNTIDELNNNLSNLFVYANQINININSKWENISIAEDDLNVIQNELIRLEERQNVIIVQLNEEQDEHEYNALLAQLAELENQMNYQYSLIAIKEIELSEHYQVLDLLYNDNNDVYSDINNIQSELDRNSYDLTFSNLEFNLYDYLYDSFDDEIYFGGLISLNLDKESYEVGDRAYLTIEYQSDSAPNYINADFYTTMLNETGRILNLNSVTTDTVMNEFGIYETKIGFDILPNYPTSQFFLNYLHLSFTDTSWDISQYDDTRFNDMVINVINSNPETVDIDGPIIKEVKLDKEKYEVGDAVYLELRLEDKSFVKDIRVSIKEIEESFNEVDEGSPIEEKPTYSNYDAFSIYDLQFNDDGSLLAVLQYIIPENLPNTSLYIESINVEDQFGNSEYWWREDIENYLNPFFIENKQNPQGDLQGPELLDISIEKSFYETGERIKVKVELSDVSQLNEQSINAHFVKENNSSDYLNSKLESVTVLENGNYEAILYFDTIGNISSGVYKLDSIGASDEFNNHKNHNLSEQDSIKIKFTQTEEIILDNDAPELINLSISNTIVEPGETVVLNLEIADKQFIGRARLYFTNGEISNPNYIYKDLTAWDFTVNERGNYESQIHLDIPLNAINSTFNLESIYLVDISNNGTGWSNNEGFLPSIMFEVKNGNPIYEVKDEIIDITYNYEGETKNNPSSVVLELKSAKELTDVKIQFMGTNYAGMNGYQFINSNSSSFRMNDNGNFEIIFDLAMANNIATDIFSLSTVTVLDSNNFENHIGFNSSKIANNIFYVINPLVKDVPSRVAEIKGISLNKEMYKEGEVAEIRVNVDSDEMIEHSELFFGLGLSEKFFSFNNSLQAKKILDNGNGNYSIFFELPISKSQPYNSIELVNLRFGDKYNNWTSGFYLDQSTTPTIDIQHVKQEEIIEEALYDIKRIPYSSLTEGEEMLIQHGSNGIKRVVYDVSYHGNKKLDSTWAFEEFTQAPINEIILVGTGKVNESKPIHKETLTENNTETTVIPYEIIYIDNSELTIGETRVTREGVNGSKTVTSMAVIVLEDGVEISRDQTSDTVVVQAISQLVERGTKPLEEDSPNPDENGEGNVPEDNENNNEIDDSETIDESEDKNESNSEEEESESTEEPDLDENNSENPQDTESEDDEKEVDELGEDDNETPDSEDNNTESSLRPVDIDVNEQLAKDTVTFYSSETGVRVILPAHLADRVAELIVKYSPEQLQNLLIQDINQEYHIFDISLLDALGQDVDILSEIFIEIPMDSNLTITGVYHYGDNMELNEPVPFTVNAENIVRFSAKDLSYFGVTTLKSSDFVKHYEPSKVYETVNFANVEQSGIALLPETGEETSRVFGIGALSILTALGLVVSDKKKEDFEEQ